MIGDCPNKTARAWQCPRFWQHESQHCQRKKFRNTCVRRNINFECL